MLGEVLVGVAPCMREFVLVFVVMPMSLHLDGHVRHRQVVVQARCRALCHLCHGLQCDTQHQQHHSGALPRTMPCGRRHLVHSATSSKRVYSA